MEVRPIRTFYDPATLSLVATGFSAFQSVSEGFAQQESLEAQASQEAVQKRRDKAALDQERDRTIARQRALLAAGGVSIGEGGSGVALLEESAGEFAVERRRGVADSNTRRDALRARGANEAAAGITAGAGQIFGGAARFQNARLRARQETTSPPIRTTRTRSSGRI